MPIIALPSGIFHRPIPSQHLLRSCQLLIPSRRAEALPLFRIPIGSRENPQELGEQMVRTMITYRFPFNPLKLWSLEGDLFCQASEECPLEVMSV